MKRWLALLPLATLPLQAFGQKTMQECHATEPAEARVKCYDEVTHRPAASAPASPETKPALPEPKQNAGRSADLPVAKRSSGRYLMDSWKLGTDDRRLDLDSIQQHKPTYVLFSRVTDRVNQQPSSPTHPALAPQGSKPDEAKFQISAKVELMERREIPSGFLDFANARLWLAYTQQSHWQVYNPALSRPLRETNYEPELILTLGRKDSDKADGPEWKLVNLGLVHQSNGQSGDRSRSWNRAYIQGGWETGGFSLEARLCSRLPEKIQNDDNPDIKSFIGRGDVVARYRFENDWSTGLLLRNNLRSSPNRGFTQFDLFTPKGWGVGNARWYLQATTGYGESLIDYNFRQNTVGFGLAFIDWQ